MAALYIIIWFLLLIASIVMVFEFVGMHLMVRYFPEGRRAWMFPMQLISLAIFAAAVAFHPWRSVWC